MTRRQRIAEDENGARADYGDIVVGKDLGSLEWIITEEDIDKQCRVDEDYDMRSAWRAP